MSDPLEDLIRQSNDFHAQMIADNNELDLKQVHRERRVVVDSRAARFHRR